MIFRQLFDKETSTYTYLLADEKTREALIIDSVLENAERDLKLIKELGLKLIYTVETHVHADHITAAAKLSEETGAKRVVPFGSGVKCADVFICDAEVLNFGAYELFAIHTPGHTANCTSYKIANMLFTGDSLFIRGNGRTDFQSGSAAALYKSINQKLYSFADETLVYPGHDYKGMTVSTIGEEKIFNPRIKLGITEEEFIKTMDSLNLPNPKLIQEAVPANLACGKQS